MEDVLTRVETDMQISRRFIVEKRDFERQYAQLYFLRLQELRDVVRCLFAFMLSAALLQSSLLSLNLACLQVKKRATSLWPPSGNDGISGEV